MPPAAPHTSCAARRQRTPERPLGRERPCPASRAAAHVRAGSGSAARRARGCDSLGVVRARTFGAISPRPMCRSAGARGLGGHGATQRAREGAPATAEEAESAARCDGVRFCLTRRLFLIGAARHHRQTELSRSCMCVWAALPHRHRRVVDVCSHFSLWLIVFIAANLTFCWRASLVS